ncbi:MAG TPA: T9SS type A sorting domain-containing protein, partial [Saprospiraceae bacterium]|nr:T9SS type A sorting domain-containing protein [Saprospiraceae bacterium]
KLVFEGFESGKLNVAAENFGVNRLENGLLTMSWNASQTASMSAEEVLFGIRFTVLSNGSIGKMMAITSDVTKAEAYTSDLAVRDVRLNVRSGKAEVEAGVFELYQNAPNPFDKVTEISFRLNEQDAARLSIYDVTGKVVYITEIQGQKGMNTITVDRADLKGSGMYYYQLDSGDHTATKRMIIIE